MQQDILSQILSFFEEAGALALKNQFTAANHFKADDSIVTETDLAISKMAHEKFADWFAKDGHIFIDEESIDQIGNPVEVFENSTYQWILDPIDGTANYSCGRHQWGMMMSVLNEGHPFVTVLYMPRQRELVYGTTEGGVFYVQEPFSENATTEQLTEIKVRPMNSQTFFELNDKALMGNPIIVKNMWASLSGSCVNGNMHAILGRGSGKVGSFKPAAPCPSCWDEVGGWAIFKMLGASVYLFNAKKEITQINGTLFQNNWRVNDNWFFAPKETLDFFHNAIEQHKEDKKDAA